MDSIQLKLLHHKGTFCNVKRHLTVWEQTFTSYLCDKGISRMYLQHKNPMAKIQPTQLGNGQITSTDSCQKKIKMTNQHVSNAQYHSSSRKCKLNLQWNIIFFLLEDKGSKSKSPVLARTRELTQPSGQCKLGPAIGKTYGHLFLKKKLDKVLEALKIPFLVYIPNHCTRETPVPPYLWSPVHDS